MTRTNTPTITNTPTSGTSYTYNNLGTGGSDTEACSEGGTAYYGIRSSFSGLQVGDFLYIDAGLITPVSGFSFVSNGTIYFQIDGGTGEIQSAAGLC